MSNYIPRDAVKRFASNMERKLRQNDHKGGWNDCAQDWLFRRLEEELAEFRIAVAEGSHLDAEDEAADVANFLLMIVDNLRSGVKSE